MTPNEQAYHELSAYTLTHGDPRFIHQHVVDAWAAQSAAPTGKPISVTFALAGLYLHVERGFSGRQVQLAHMRMARKKQTWPHFDLPDRRGEMTAMDVLAVAAGPERDAAIDAWCASVWGAFVPQRDVVVALLTQHGVL